jgi:hypothetical protein
MFGASFGLGRGRHAAILPRTFKIIPNDEARVYAPPHRPSTTPQLHGNLMPFFKVTKGQDAYVEYVAIIEADDPEQARQEAGSWEFAGQWWPNGNITEFDHSEVFEDCVERVEAASLEEAEATLATA